MTPETVRGVASISAGVQPTEDSSPLSTGCEWIVDATGCDPALLKDQSVLAELFRTVVADLRLNVIGTVHWHQFPGPGGVTGLALLSESHLACHTYPEFQLLTLNLYCCRPRADWPWERELRRRVGASQVCVRTVDRGVREGEAPE